MIDRLAAFLLGLSLFATAQPASQQYEPVFENDVVVVYRLDLAPGQSVSTLQSSHDSFWLSLDRANLTFSVQRGTAEVEFLPGDTRFFPSFDTKRVSNNGSTEFRGVLVALKPRALISEGCDCTGNTGRTVCGCKDAGHLESLWAFNMGAVTLAGTRLAPEEQFRAAAQRDDMLLVAVTDIDLLDDAQNDLSAARATNSTIRLNSGGAVWIRGGRHLFKNVGGEAAKFITFEF